MATKTHVVLTGSKREKDPKATRIGDVDPKEKIVVTIGIAGPKLPDPDEYVGETLTPTQFAEKFGAQKSDSFLSRRILQIQNRIARERCSKRFSPKTKQAG